MKTAEVINKLQLVDGEFTTSEASDVINALIKEKINFHKLHRLSIYERYMDTNTDFDDSRISQLQKAQTEFIEICNEARLAGKKIRINGVLNVEIID